MCDGCVFKVLICTVVPVSGHSHKGLENLKSPEGDSNPQIWALVVTVRGDLARSSSPGALVSAKDFHILRAGGSISGWSGGR